jgi:hypothetical protein
MEPFSNQSINGFNLIDAIDLTGRAGSAIGSGLLCAQRATGIDLLG